MAKFVLKDCHISVGGVDVSDHASSVTVETTNDQVDVTSYSVNEYREFTDGFKDASITATFFQDFAAAELDSVLWPLYTGGTSFEVAVRPTSAAAGTANPVYKLPACRLYDYSPLGGGIGDAASTDVTFKNSGTAGLTRGVA